MQWHYQTVKKLGNGDEELYEIHEKYIDDDSPGRVYELNQNPVIPRGSSLGELRAELIQMLSDLERHDVIDQSCLVEFSARYHHAAVR